MQNECIRNVSCSNQCNIHSKPGIFFFLSLLWGPLDLGLIWLFFSVQHGQELALNCNRTKSCNCAILKTTNFSKRVWLLSNVVFWKMRGEKSKHVKCSNLENATTGHYRLYLLLYQVEILLVGAKSLLKQLLLGRSPQMCTWSSNKRQIKPSV